MVFRVSVNKLADVGACFRVSVNKLADVGACFRVSMADFGILVSVNLVAGVGTWVSVNLVADVGTWVSVKLVADIWACSRGCQRYNQGMNIIKISTRPAYYLVSKKQGIYSTS